MIDERAFTKACKETLEVLENVDDNEYNKIPINFISFLKENADMDYSTNINFDEDFEKQELLPETIDLLAYIYRKYLCDEQEKIAFDKAMHENEQRYQEKLAKEYSIDFFSNNKQEKIEENNLDNKLPVKYSENFLKKVIRYIKNKINIIKKAGT